MICIGYKQRKLAAERSERQLNWMIYSSFGDPKKMPKSAQAWWPIEGEPKPKPIRVNKAYLNRIKNFHDFIMSEGWRKNKNG